VPVDEVLNDCMRVFHHPSLRDPHCEVHNNMYEVVKQWAHNYRGKDLNQILSSESVKAGHNHSGDYDHSTGHSHGAVDISSFGGHSHGSGGSHGGGHGGSHGGGYPGQQRSSGSSDLFGSLTGVLPGPLGGMLGSFSGSSGRTRDMDDGFSATSPSAAPAPYPPSSPPPPSPWASFQPYQSSYAGEAYQPPAEYSNAVPSGGYGWGQGQYSGGHGAEPSYTVPTNYQQGYENYSAMQEGYGQPPAQQPPPGSYGAYGQSDAYGQSGAYGSYAQGPSEGSGRAWGSGGNSGW
jgi:hypothetical protein